MGAEAAKASIGTTFSVCATLPATYDEAGYEALTWVVVGLVTTIPEMGDTSADITASTLADGRIVHFNGEKDGGVGDLEFIHDAADAGQVILKAGANTNTVHSFRVADVFGSEHYFIGMIGSYTQPSRNTGTFEGRVCSIRRNTAIVIGT